ncbi:MAG: DUF4397 domain-containing protein [Roseiflexaceae bacterium]|nr:DUF4397 domain-containing protein [Roseiflexus sp.]MDW8213550.1 DUF4397 domain-containing protein [Roseiflexaceae bacterium]
MIRRSFVAFIAFVAVALASFLTPVASPAVAASGSASVYIIHGIPGRDLGLKPRLPVDVAVNGACALKNFKFRDVVGPLSLPAGTYNIRISLANRHNPCGNPPVINADVPFKAGESATVIAHLSADGKPTASKFVNDLSPAKGAGNGPVIARHTAAVPAVDLLVRQNRKSPIIATLPNLKNGEQVRAELPIGQKFLVQFALAGTTHVVASARIEACAGEVAIYHAVGSLKNRTFTIIPLYIPLR